ncbi:MAG TPA: MGMT family protein [Terriglobales bacterium]|nr:MGMT family protein [Terriglobales bacterium]
MKRRSQSKSEKSEGKSASGRSVLDDRRARVVRCIRGLPAGKVSSYGALAKAAGWAGAARQVVRILQQVPGLPWHRVVGSGGAIKLCGENAAEQRFRLRMEGVTFRGARVDMKRHEFRFSKMKLPKGKRSPSER